MNCRMDPLSVPYSGYIPQKSYSDVCYTIEELGEKLGLWHQQVYEPVQDMSAGQRRDRGRVLTDTGLEKLRRGIHAWEQQQGRKATHERLAEIAHLDPGVIANIRNQKKRADLGSIDRLFTILSLALEDQDTCPELAIPNTLDPNFVGREDAIADLDILAQQAPQVIVIQAKGGIGKTTLARYYLKQHFATWIEFPIAKEAKDIAAIDGLLEEKLRQLGEEPGQDFWVSLDRLKRRLQTDRIGILIDNLETALDAAGKFIEPHRRYLELLRVLGDPAVQSLTLITSREWLYESSITVQPYRLKELDVTAWKQFFQARNLPADAPALTCLHQAHGGNAKAMDILCAVIHLDYGGNIESYWQANQDDLLLERPLEDLVTSQFNRLQQLDTDAYHLLCRLGCYRYQDVPTISLEGLSCLLWDVPATRHRRVVNSLQTRSLLETDQGLFWLHPVIRAEAIARLRASNDWDIAHRNAATFWTTSVPIIASTTDAVHASEAYYHYQEIGDLPGAVQVLLQEKQNHWQETLPLCSHLYRLGLIQQTLSKLDYVVNRLNYDIDPLSLSKLHITIGNIHWIRGDIATAIAHQETSNAILDALPPSTDADTNTILQKRRLYSLHNISMYKLDLWELAEAETMFQTVLAQAEACGFHRLVVKVSSCLAFVKSCLGDRSTAAQLAEFAHRGMITTNLMPIGIGSFVFHGQYLGQAYRNLGAFTEAQQIYDQIFAKIQQTERNQVLGKALNGMAGLYRDLQDYETALKYHTEAIATLEALGARCDLAEAHFQLGISYYTMQQPEKSSSHIQAAIQLFTEIGAPKQVQKVQDWLNNHT